mmetsp:Transcript_5152/g.7169  ORF Transcript_5152/g.7169 Transcript_5152/m.7169 type:complete len:145 (-) Transcript_5152:113-547(-)
MKFLLQWLLLLFVLSEAASETPDVTSNEFYKPCVDLLDERQSTASLLTSSQYAQFLATLTKGHVDTTYNRLPLGLIATFNANACWGGRPCLRGQAKVPIATQEDRDKTCFMICNVLEKMDMSLEEDDECDGTNATCGKPHVRHS